jgi:hypothetical protein
METAHPERIRAPMTTGSQTPKLMVLMADTPSYVALRAGNKMTIYLGRIRT